MAYTACGGASTATQDGISDRLISQQVRWSSETVRNGYIQDSTTTRLSLSLRIVTCVFNFWERVPSFLPLLLPVDTQTQNSP